MSSPPGPVLFFQCTSCMRQILVTPEHAGVTVTCPCGVLNRVPSLAQLGRFAKESQGESPFRPAHSQAVPQGAGAVAGSPFQPAPIPQPQASPPAPACPFCHQPLQPGRIFGDRYKLKWLPCDVPLTIGIWAAGGLEIGHGGFMQFNRPHVCGWRCASCCRIIVDERA